MRTWSTKETAEIVGMPLSTLDSWVALGVIRPEVPARGRGTGRKFVFRDVVLVEVARVLASHSVALEAIGAIVGGIREHWPGGDPADAGAILVSPDGGTLVIGGMPGDPFDPESTRQAAERGGWTIRNPDKAVGLGELMFRVNVTSIARRLQERIAELDRE